MSTQIYIWFTLVFMFQQGIVLIIQMDIEKVGAQQSHNLLLTTFLPSQQVKHMAFIRLDSARSLLHHHRELRFHSGLVTATNNTLRLYSLATPNDNQSPACPIALEVGSWRLHEDITGVAGWDRIIVVSTAQKVVGFKYEQGLLKNAFLISLEFLQLDPQDSCTMFADKLGHYLLIYVRNYLLICFSETATNKYKGRAQERQRMVELVSEECRWSEPGKNHIVDMVKIKLVGQDINKVQQIQLLDDSFFFVGHRNREKILFTVQISNFFHSNDSALLAPFREQPPPNSRILLHHSNYRTNALQMLYHHIPTHTLTLKSQHTSFQVGTFEGTIEFFPYGAALFPLLLWEPQKGRLYLVERVKTFQENYQFKVKQIAEQCWGEKVLFREGVTVTAGRSGVALLGPTGERIRIHQSLGSIMDLHMGRDMLVIENPEGKVTRVFELTKGPRVDPKPFVTHKKKMFLEGLSDLIAIYSFLLGQRKLEVLAVRRGTGANKLYTLYREGPAEFEALLSDIRFYHEATINGNSLLLLQTKNENSLMVTAGEQGLITEPFEWSGWKMTKRWCQENYLIAYDEQRNWVFYNILTRQERKAEVGKGRTGQVGAFLQFRSTTYDRSLKGHDIAEIYFVYQQELEIWLIDLTTGDPSLPCQPALVHVTHRLSQGPPVLTNQLLFSDSHEKDAYRSITCAEYNLNQHGTRIIAGSQGIILSAHLSQGDKTLLVLVSSEECILIYRKYFSVEDGGFIFRRLATPLPIVKNFKWAADKSFLDLGQGLVKFGNVLIYKGELVESIPARSLFRMEGALWGLLGEGKIRLVHLGGQVYEGFCMRQVECGIGEELMGIDSTSQFYCAYSRKAFEVFGKDFTSQWKCQLGNETIVSLRMFDHYVGMSYYDYYCDEEGVNDYNSVRFRFRVYNCATKNKIIEREKPLDEPILHIRFMSPDKLILVTSSLIFVNVLKNDKTLQLYRTHNFSSKRSFLSAFDYLPDKLSAGFGTQGSPGYMLFGGSHGGLGFFVGKWIQEEKLKEQWFQGFRCGIRQVAFFQYGEEKDELLKALMADEDGNLIVLTLKVDHAEKIADIRLGSPVNTFKTKSGSERAVYCSMGDGSIKLLTAVKLDSEVSYLDFQKSFCQELPFYGGFNLRTSRRLTQKYRSGRLVSRGNVVDGDLLQSFFSLTSTLRRFVLEDSDMQLGPLKSILPF